MSTKAIQKWFQASPNNPTELELDDEKGGDEIDAETQEHSLQLLQTFRPKWTGVVKKEGHVLKNWRERYFSINHDLMLYYKSERDFSQGLSPVGYHVVADASSDSKFIFVKTQCDKTFKLQAGKDSAGLIAALKRACDIASTSEHTLQYKGYPQLQLAISLSHRGYIREAIATLVRLVSSTSLGALSSTALSTLALPTTSSNSFSSTPTTNTSQDNLQLYLYHLGTAYLVDQNYFLAVQCLQQAVDIRRSNERDSTLSLNTEELSQLAVPCIVNLGTALHLSGDTAQGLLVLEEGLLLDSKSLDVLNNIVVLLCHDATPEGLDLAENYIKRALNLHRKDPRIYITYADYLLRVQDQTLGEAIDVLFEGLTEVPVAESSPLLFRIGHLLFNSSAVEQQSEALDYFERAVHIDPKNGRAVDMLAAAVKHREELDLALGRPSQRRRDAVDGHHGHKQDANDEEEEEAALYPDAMGGKTTSDKDIVTTPMNDWRFADVRGSLPSQRQTTHEPQTTPVKQQQRQQRHSMPVLPVSNQVPLESSTSHVTTPSDQDNIADNYTIEGMLSKKSGKLSIWQERYFQLSEARHALEWFSHKSSARQDSKANNSIAMRDVVSVSFGSESEAQSGSEASDSQQSSSFCILTTSGRTFQLRAGNVSEAGVWLVCLRQAMAAVKEQNQSPLTPQFGDS